MRELTVDERMMLANADVYKQMAIDNKESQQFLIQEYRSYSFYSRENYGKLTDEQFHTILDEQKIPKQVEETFWTDFLIENPHLVKST